MRRRFAGLAAAALLACLAGPAAAQQMPLVGFLSGGSEQGYTRFAAAFRQGLGELGYIAGRNVRIDYRWADGHPERLPPLAGELVREGASVIAAAGGPAAPLAALSGTLVAAPLPLAAAQQSLPLIGFLTIAELGARADGFRRGLAEAGYVEGRTVAIEYRVAAGHYERLPAMAAELVDRKVAVIVTGGPPAARAAKAATATIPIVFLVGNDPVKEGLVASLARPGGNLTGVSILARDLTSKRLELLTELVPQARTVGLLVNPSNAAEEQVVTDLQAAAREKSLDLVILKAQTEAQIAAAFAGLDRLHVGALVVGNDSFLTRRHEQIVGAAMRARVPAIYAFREYADAGGLISYGTDVPAAYRQVGIYTGKILAGAKPADLPVQQPTKFELVINLKTAKALGLTVPQSLLARADEVIE